MAVKADQSHRGRPIFSGNRSKKGGSFDAGPAPSSALHAVVLTPMAAKDRAGFQFDRRQTCLRPSFEAMGTPPDRQFLGHPSSFKAD
jgi:hypothetical protein